MCVGKYDTFSHIHDTNLSNKQKKYSRNVVSKRYESSRVIQKKRVQMKGWCHFTPQAPILFSSKLKHILNVECASKTFSHMIQGGVAIDIYL